MKYNIELLKADILDEEYISRNEFKDVYEQARRTRAAVRGSGQENNG